ncbi:hypothetical protein [Leptospira saintgironsiae]|nr:hypothetical protein [Leptospira saintgironsiae]
MPPNPFIDLAQNSIACDTPNSSSCTVLGVNTIISVKRLCALYLPNSNPIDHCSETSIAACLVNGYALEKRYYNTGPTPWDKNSASADCSSLGGELE